MPSCMIGHPNSSAVQKEAKCHHWHTLGERYVCRLRAEGQYILLSSSIQKVIRSLPFHNPTRRWSHPYPASYGGRPVWCFGLKDCVVHNTGIGLENVLNEVVQLNFGGFRICFGLVTAVVFVAHSSSDEVLSDDEAAFPDLFDLVIGDSQGVQYLDFVLDESLFVVLRPRLAEDLGLPGLLLSRVLWFSSVSSSSEDDKTKVKCFFGFLDESRVAEIYPTHDKPLRRPERRVDESRCWKSPSSSLILRFFTTSSLWPRPLKPSVRRPWQSIEALWCVINEAKKSSSESSDDEAATTSVDTSVKSTVTLGNSVSSSSHSVIRRSASVRRSFGQLKVMSGFVPYAESSCEALSGVVANASDFLSWCESNRL